MIDDFADRAAASTRWWRSRFLWRVVRWHHGHPALLRVRERKRQVDRAGRAALTELWQRRWPLCLPVGHKIRGPYRDVWVRFHSLPESKRYPEDESEYAVVLERYNTVLDELFAGTEVYVITPVWTSEPAVPASRPGGGHWQSLLAKDDPDEEFRTYCHLFVSHRPWEHGCIDETLREIADDELAGVLVTDTQLRRIYHPYDGGADVFLPTPQERDRLRDRHATWLSGHPLGL
ncbi:hypothetical protein [Streptomyces althioticus]|uniref:DUF3885 domain-containing protein n=1 Tax=Streptomyces althioticus TaxID=83380 RepID=UPI0036FE55C4|nr:hypothetical protein OG968_33520 [Streptomyces althioticus]